MPRFKAALMFFSESYLKGANLNDIKLEGDEPIQMATIFLEMTKNLLREETNLLDWQDLNVFREYLQAGIPIAKEIFYYKLNRRDEIELEDALNIQNKLKKTIYDNGGLILPSGWVGHSIALVFRLGNKSGTVDMTVVNTGDGVNFHYETSDPDGVYPSLSQIWIEFKEIEMSEIFHDNTWFLQTLINLNKDKFKNDLMSRLKKQPWEWYEKSEPQSSALPEYFYGSILPNFLDNLITKPSDRFFIGNNLIKSILNDLDNDPNFIQVITDGFAFSGRSFFKRLASAIAELTLRYLEIFLPEHFKHAGLIGSERSIWLFKRKPEAIAELSKNKQVHDVILESVYLSNEIIRVLNDHPIESSTNLIIVKAKDLSHFIPVQVKNMQDLSLKMDAKNLRTDPYEYIEGYPDRFESPIEDFDTFYQTFKNTALTTIDSKYFYRIMDVFRSVIKSKNNWCMMIRNGGTLDQLMDFQIICNNVAKAFGRSHCSTLKIPTSFDDVVMLAYLQRLAWEIAVGIDEQTTNQNMKLNLADGLAPPQTLQSVLFGIHNESFNVLAGYMNPWLVKNCFDRRNVELFMNLLEEEGTFKMNPKPNFFLGPHNFHRNLFNSDASISIELLNDKANQNVYAKMMQNPIVDVLYQGVKHMEEWKDLSEEEAKFAIVFAEHSHLHNFYPHYYKLMDTLAAIRIGIIQRDTQFFMYYWIRGQANTIWFNYKLNDLHKMSKPVVKEYHELVTFVQNDVIPFYRMRHSLALTPELDLTNFDTWLNYIKCARNAKIFDENYFRYLTDHLLNVPKWNAQGEVMFPVDQIIATETITELLRLIRISKEVLAKSDSDLSQNSKARLYARIVNISVILTRFISRLDSEDILTGKTCAKELANLYNLIFSLSKSDSNYLGLEGKQIAGFNFVLCFICSVPMRNAATFMKSIYLNTMEAAIKLRATLKKFHWFLAKKDYIISGFGVSIVDDQFNYGLVADPLHSCESEFFLELLRAFFLPSLMEDPSILDIIKFHPSGYVIEMMTSNQDSDTKVMINLWTSALVHNQNNIARLNVILNSSEFHAYFSAEEKSLISSSADGIAIEAAGCMVYALPEFKGRSYLMISKRDPKGFLSTTILRKCNDKWYHWTLSGNVNDLRHKLGGIQDSWLSKVKFYQNNIGEHYELFGFDSESNKPLLKVKIDKITDQLGICINDYCKGNYWQVVSPNQILQYKKMKSKFRSEQVKFEKHIDTFAPKNFIIARDVEGHHVIICPDYVFPDAENQKIPLILLENDKIDGSGASEFSVLNCPNMKICADQELIEGSSLPGTLIAEFESKNYLLIPLKQFVQLEYRNALFAGSTPNQIIEIQKIPMVLQLEQKNVVTDSKNHDLIIESQKKSMVRGSPAPQSRIHRILLASYMIQASFFDAARLLLHPSASIHQNEPFSVQELIIFDWIFSIDLEAPEVTALKLYVYIHYIINKFKFPLKHAEHGHHSSLVIALENFRKFPRKVSDYMFSIRELPEKYYVYRVFPEVLSEPLFTQIFGEAVKTKQIAQINDKSEDFSRLYYFGPGKLSSFEIGKQMNWYDVFRSFAEENRDYANFIKNIMVRKSSRKIFFEELTLFCGSIDQEIRLSLKEKTDQGIVSTVDLEPTLKDIVTRCVEKYSRYFKGINFYEVSTATELEDMKKVMQADLNRIKLKNIPVQNSIRHDLVSPEDIKMMEKLRVKLETFIKNEGNSEGELDKNSTIHFNTNLNSNVLTNLSDSIDKFLEEQGHNRLLEINFNDQIDILNQLISLNSFLTDRINELLDQQSESSAKLTDMTNTNLISKDINDLLSLMHHRKVKTFANLYSCYMNETLPCIQKKFPQLSLKDCAEVQKDTVIFYSRQVLIDYYKILKKSADDFLTLTKFNKAASVDDLTIFCDELHKITEFNGRMEYPVIMNFEFRSRKYRLKTEQLKDIKLLVSDDDSKKFYQSVVIQRMMAAGKTLVLGTISVVMKALKKNRLSILVPPSSLYQSNTTAMQNRTYEYFKKKGKNFSFPRFLMPLETEDLTKNVLANYLNTVIRILNDTIESENYLILSPDDLASFLNSYIEFLFQMESKWNPNYEEMLENYSRIYRTFKTCGSIILDEIDMTLDPKKELNFPTSDSESYNMTAVALLADIMEFLVFDQSIMEAGLLIHSNNQASLTPENYKKHVIRLVLEYIERQLLDEKSIWFNLIFLKGNHQESVKTIMKFLGTPSMVAMKGWITGLHDRNNEVIANALIIIKSQLYRYFEHSLKGTVNQNFGSAGNLRSEKYAVPYVAANTPSPASVFADRWETLIKTLLMVSAFPCPMKTTLEVIKYVRKAILSESSDLVPYTRTPTFTNMKHLLQNKLCPLQIDIYNSKHVDIVHEALGLRSPAAIRILFSYYMNEVFDKITFPIEQITSNALNMASMFGSVQGYSGTIDNVNILPQKVIVKARQDHEDNEKYNGGISMKLVKDHNDELVPFLEETAFSKSAQEMVQDVLNLYPGYCNKIYAIIDAGAFFKSFKNRKVAEAVLIASKGRLLVGIYYDEDSNQLEFVRMSETGSRISFAKGFLDTNDPEYIRRTTNAEIHQRFTFYDQRHITGSDILQHKDAHALLTAGPRILLRDILQGTLRMRQFMTSQKVHLISTESTHQFYCSKINSNKPDFRVSDVLTLGALNEDDKQAQENEKLAFAKIDAEIRSFVLDEISRSVLGNSEDVERKELVRNLVKRSKKLFLRSIKETPLAWLHEIKEEDTDKILKVYAISRLGPLMGFINRFNKESAIYRRFNDLKRKIVYMISSEKLKEKDSLLHYTKEKICTPISLQSGTEVQLQAIALSLVDLNMDQLIDRVDRGLSPEEYQYDLVNEMCKFEHEEYFQSPSGSFMSLKDLYANPRTDSEKVQYLKNTLISSGKRVAVTQDLVKLFLPANQESNHYPILSNFTIEGTHLLIQVLPAHKGLKVYLISSKHASNTLSHLKHFTDSGQYHSVFWLCDLSGRVTGTNDPESKRGQNILDFIPQVKELMFDALIFNGSLPQILDNPQLRDIYYSKWLGDEEHFEARAIFLRLRMKVLFQKNDFMFEDDDKEYGKLRQHSLGINRQTEALVDGYPKQPVLELYELDVRRDMNLIRSQAASSSKQENESKFDLTAELRNIFEIPVDLEDLKPPLVTYLESPKIKINRIEDDLDFREFEYTEIHSRDEINLPIFVDDLVTAKSALKITNPVVVDDESEFINVNDVEIDHDYPELLDENDQETKFPLNTGIEIEIPQNHHFGQ